MLRKMGFENDIKEVLLSEEDIRKKVREIAQRITNDYKGMNPLMICILRGAVPFFVDLCKCVEDYLEMDFMQVSSYEDGMKSNGIVRIKKDIDKSIEGRHVIIVDDIMDSGNTLNHLTKLLKTRNPASLKIVCLLDKPKRRTCDITPDYYGFIVPDEFVVGYGLDYADAYRNLPYIGILKPEVYSDEK